MNELQPAIFRKTSGAARVAFDAAHNGLTLEQQRIAWEIFYPRWICETRAARDAAGEFAPLTQLSYKYN